MTLSRIYIYENFTLISNIFLLNERKTSSRRFSETIYCNKRESRARSILFLKEILGDLREVR